MKLHRALAVIGAGVLVFAASDVITYAATGSSVVLGAINQANRVTTVQNTGPGSALRLVTSSAATPPLVVNGKGKVTNLYADRAATADNAAKLGGLTPAQIEAAAVQHVTPARVLWVAKSGGNFTSVKAALAAIHDNAAARPYLIEIAPGTYTETGGLTMKSFVDLEGSGENNTVIACACGSATSPYADGSSATVRIAGPGTVTEVRNLAVRNTGPSTYSTGVRVSGSVPALGVSLRNVRIDATGGVGNYGLVNVGSEVTVVDSMITASGGASGTEAFGIANVFGAAMWIRNVDAYALGPGAGRYAAFNNGSNLQADSSAFIGIDQSIASVGAAIAYVANSMVTPIASGSAADYQCVGAYTGMYTAVGPACR